MKALQTLISLLFIVISNYGVILTLNIKIIIDTNKGTSNRFIGLNYKGAAPDQIYGEIDENSVYAVKEGTHEIKLEFNESTFVNPKSMFQNCDSIISIEFSSFSPSENKEMSYMFSGCKSLVSLDLSNFDTSKVEGMSYMFNGCESLVSLDLSNFNTSKVSSMLSMFDGCKSLVSLDISNFNTSQVGYLPELPNSLEYIDIINYEGTNDIFLNLESNNNLKVCRKIDSEFLQGKPDCYIKIKMKATSAGNYPFLNSYFFSANKPRYILLNEEVVTSFTNEIELTTTDENVIKIKFNNKITSTNDMFQNYNSIKDIDLSNLDATSVTDMSQMFMGCNSLESINLANINTSNVEILVICLMDALL